MAILDWLGRVEVFEKEYVQTVNLFYHAQRFTYNVAVHYHDSLYD